MSSIISFQYGTKEVRILKDEDGATWWVARDVCNALEIVNVGDAISRLDDDEKGVQNLDTPVGRRKMSTISESGLFSLILRSIKPQAKPFRKWVTAEVLPAIRKTGKYKAPTEAARIAKALDPLAPLAKELKAAVELAKAVGLKGNQAVLSANQLINKRLGADCLAMLDVTHLVAEKQALHTDGIGGGCVCHGAGGSRTLKIDGG